MLVESLNEESTRIKRGMKRNTMVTTKTVWENENLLLYARFA
jgi:hypothetical protein